MLHWSIDLQPREGMNYDVIIFDKTSLKELPKEAYPGSKKLLLDNGLSNQEGVFLFLFYKLSGVLCSEATFENFLKALEMISKGEVWLSRTLVNKLSENYEIFNDRLTSLTSKEKEIVILLSKGFSNKEISNYLHLSTHTIKSHLNRIFQKTEVKNRTQLAKIFLNSLNIQDNASQTKKSTKIESNK